VVEPQKGEEISRAVRQIPEEGKSQERYSNVAWVKLSGVKGCDKAGVKLQGRPKLMMEAGSFKRTRG
jgi:hypothetical protein